MPIVSRVLDVNATPEMGVFHAVFWNYDQLTSPQLSGAFWSALRTYCGKAPTMLTDQVIITADERSPRVKTEGLFRCEKAGT